jgi:hypothetical protein
MQNQPATRARLDVCRSSRGLGVAIVSIGPQTLQPETSRGLQKHLAGVQGTPGVKRKDLQGHYDLVMSLTSRRRPQKNRSTDTIKIDIHPGHIPLAPDHPARAFPPANRSRARVELECAPVEGFAIHLRRVKQHQLGIPQRDIRRFPRLKIRMEAIHQDCRRRIGQLAKEQQSRCANPRAEKPRPSPPVLAPRRCEPRIHSK